MSATTTPSRHTPRGRRRIGKKLTSVMLAGLVLAGGTVTFDSLSAPSAEAIDLNGARINIGGETYVGNFIANNGKRSYCLEIFRTYPEDGAVHNNVTSLPATDIASYWNSDIGIQVGAVGQGALTGRDFDIFRYIISKYGETADANQAAAVQLAIWKIRGNSGTGAYQQVLSAYTSRLPAQSASADSMINEAAAWLNAGGNFEGSGSEAPSGNPIIKGNPADPYRGVIDVPASTTELTLTNGVFPSTGTNKITFNGGAAAGTSVQFQGVPPTAETWDRYYRVTLNGKYRYEVWGLPGYEDSPGLAQDHGWGGDHEERSGDFDAVHFDPDTLWAPELSTETPAKIVQEGEAFSDTVTFQPRQDIGSGIWRWAKNSAGETRYAPIKATGTLYGPFLSDPALNPSGTPPKGAPVAATAEVTTDTGRDHSQPQTYEVKTTEVSQEAGYYTWVWNIDSSDQDASVTRAARTMLPENYSFTDGFGRASEGQTSPTQLRLSTQLSKDSVVISDTFTDEVSVNLSKGGWLQGEDGKRLPFTVTGTAYLSDEAPVQSPIAPEGAEVLATTTVTASSPEEVLTSEAIRVPLTTKANYVTMQWCFEPDAQANAESAGKVEAWCDDYGVSSETARIIRPEVTTKAQEVGTVRGDVHDVASVTGGMPENAEASVDFTAYLKPEAGQPKYDENWKPVLDENGDPVLWSEDEVNDPEAVCEAQPVAHTDRVKVDGVGSYESPKVRAETEGTLYWVEELFIEDPETGEEVSLHRGKCGLPEETTEIEKPKVTTKAVESAEPGDEIWDTAIVEGPLSDREEISYEVTFEAYHRDKGETTKVNEELCTDDTKVWETDKPTTVSEEGEYQSEKWKVNSKHIGEILWVETLWQIERTDEGENRYELHRGKCGEKDEITRVVEPKSQIAVVATGSDSTPIIAGIAGGILVLAGVALAFVIRSRRKSASSNEASENEQDDLVEAEQAE